MATVDWSLKDATGVTGAATVGVVSQRCSLTTLSVEVVRSELGFQRDCLSGGGAVACIISHELGKSALRLPHLHLTMYCSMHFAFCMLNNTFRTCLVTDLVNHNFAIDDDG